jgi:hypothetical protein
MISTFPIPIGYLTKSFYSGSRDAFFVLGRRVIGLLSEPFDKETLQKRVLRKSGDKSKAQMAYYIDTRSLALRLDQVVGPMNWETDIREIKDAGDRVCVTAALTIAGITRVAEGEELKNKIDYKTNLPASQELVLMKAGPQARKRAAVEFGVGAYLYDFSGLNTWEEIDTYGNPKDPSIDLSKFPEWARPTPGPVLIAREVAYLLKINLPADISKAEKDDVTVIQAFLAKYFGVKTLATGFSRADYIELAAVIARIADFLDVNGGDIESLPGIYNFSLQPVTLKT